jgi:dipeptidase D
MVSKRNKERIPRDFWYYFEKISQIPRCSGNEEGIRQFIIGEAEKFGYQVKLDTVKNLLVSIPPLKGPTDTIILQSHLDMVCEKNSETIHDFKKDPLSLEYVIIDNEEYLTAQGTTLGADNGTGVAYQLALMKNIHEGTIQFNKIALDILCTISEERDLLGAFQIDQSMIRGNRLINLDGESDEHMIIGNPGGLYTNIDLKIIKKEMNNALGDLRAISIELKGLKGGHSGIDIDKKRANAIILLAEIIFELQKSHAIRLHSFEGGNTPNVIPRESKIIALIKKDELDPITRQLKAIQEKIQHRYHGIETGISLSVEPSTSALIVDYFNQAFQDDLLSCLIKFPNGALSYHPKFKNVVFTSSNLASITTAKLHVKIISLQRSFDDNGNLEVSNEIKALFNQVNWQFKVKSYGNIGSWIPNLSSEFLQCAMNTYKEMFDHHPIAEPVHGILETGILKVKFPFLDMINIGPNIIDPHSPSERLEVKSVLKVWNFLSRYLKSLDKPR